MEIKTKMLFEDIKAYYFYHYGKKVLGYFIFLIFTVVATFFFRGYQKGDRFDVYMLLISIILGIIISSVFSSLYILYLLWYGKRLLKSNKLFRYEQTYIFDDEGIFNKSEIGEAKIKWKDFYKAAETKKAFIIYVSRYQAFIIPKREIKENQGIQYIRNLLKSSLNGNFK
ncbi:MAG TPA: YcxB family protein [Pseudobacteroides sp.]|uniref:YcxB family protein n=1 Tax=Pseudobacteroides sp. TaxID=1968840 RepID=UPI002F91EC4B